MLTTILLMTSTCAIFWVCTLYLKVIRYKEELTLKEQSIKYLETINAELQPYLPLETNQEELTTGKVAKIA